MKEPTKQQFFALYWGQRVLIRDFGTTIRKDEIGNEDKIRGLEKDRWLELKPISSISDEDAIEVAKAAYQSKWNFEVVSRKGSMIHIEYTCNRGIWNHVGIDSMYATICTNCTIDGKSFETSIGRIQTSSRKPIPYIYILDYLRSKGYALPYLGISVEEQERRGWIKLIR